MKPEELLKYATRFTIRHRDDFSYRPAIHVEWRDDNAWVITNGVSNLNVHDEWEHEPLPGARDDAFRARTRMTAADAIERAFKYVEEGRY